MKAKVICALCATLAAALGGCHNDGGTPPKPPVVGDGPFKPPPIVVSPILPNVTIDGATGSLPLQPAASYGWSAFIALSWPSSAARGVPDPAKSLDMPGPRVWETMRSKVEVYPGNASASVPPHGVVLDPNTMKPINGPAYGYGEVPQYNYAAGQLQPCPGQRFIMPPAYVSLDETTQINNNQTFAGAAPATDPTGYNSKPQLIRYALKINQPIYTNVISNRFWYNAPSSPLATAKANYVTALNTGQQQDPTPPYVNFAPPPTPTPQPEKAGIEIKSSWRPLSATEAAGGHFIQARVRYYEQPDGKTSCYREATWGLVGMHVISFAASAPWVIWTSFEQTDNILTADGKSTEDVDGNVVIPAATPTTPALSSNPNQANPTVTASGPYCSQPGLRLHFQENPNYGTLPSAGKVCVNGRWWPAEPTFVKANQEAHAAIAKYLAPRGGSSPLMYYKMVSAQGVPVDYDARSGGTFSTQTSYYSANATIETDYSMGNFTGRLVKGVPSNLGPTGQPFYNTQLLPFQSARLSFGKMRMGGCAGCHDNGALRGQDFSFALGNNVTQPEATNAFATPNLLRNYFPGT